MLHPTGNQRVQVSKDCAWYGGTVQPGPRRCTQQTIMYDYKEKSVLDFTIEEWRPEREEDAVALKTIRDAQDEQLRSGAAMPKLGFVFWHTAVLPEDAAAYIAQLRRVSGWGIVLITPDTMATLGIRFPAGGMAVFAKLHWANVKDYVKERNSMH